LVSSAVVVGLVLFARGLQLVTGGAMTTGEALALYAVWELGNAAFVMAM
jgi:hypothetical protein